ncbi:DNA polymerase III subunit beta [Kitasatospora sp. MMS16-BH015]|uniref:DNA polymerase III subunit beta n=1 Tax=Kitasatospora sp. MMS16-BH015 TaxID=2018025 RepID=UPI000CF2D4C6|nr:DNA polymerase III subunit beta [Kitasatospora sp. MMS16-BH015]
MTSSTPAPVPARIEITVDRAQLSTGLAAVRFAAGDYPDLPMLSGVLFELQGDTLNLVASDGYRIAFARVAVDTRTATSCELLIPVSLAEDIQRLAHSTGGDHVHLVAEGFRLLAAADGRLAEGRLIDLDYPDYRRLLRLEAVHRVTVEAQRLRRTVTDGQVHRMVRAKDGVPFDAIVLALGPDGSLRVAEGEEEAADNLLRVGFNREFLLEALAASATDQLVLELGGPIHPLAIRSAGEDGTFSILMPTLLP